MSAGGRPARLLRLRWRPFRLPLRHRFEAAHGALADRTGVLLELHDSEGRVGLGEASPMPSLGDGSVEDVLRLLEGHAGAILRAPDEALAALLSAETPTPALPPSGGGGRSGDVPGRVMLRASALADTPTPAFPANGGGGRGSEAWPGSQPGAAALACGLDTALLDLEGQRRGLPVAGVLAERPLRAVPVNAVVGSGSSGETAAFAAEAVAAGYGVLKLKVATADLETDVARIAAVRRVYPGVRIRLDANGAWTEAAARRALTALAGLDVELVEQPVRASAVRALGRLRRGLVRVAADEAVSEPGAVETLMAQRAADLLVLKPMRLGGPRRSIEIARAAAAAGIPSFVTTTFDSSIGTAAALHLAAALGGGRPADGLSTGDHLADDLVTRPLRPRNGVLRIPRRAGLGVELRPAAVERLATGPWSEVRRR